MCLHTGLLGITAYNHAEEHPNNSILWVLTHALDLFYFMGWMMIISPPFSTTSPSDHCCLIHRIPSCRKASNAQAPRRTFSHEDQLIQGHSLLEGDQERYWPCYFHHPDKQRQIVTDYSNPSFNFVLWSKDFASFSPCVVSACLLEMAAFLLAVR